MDPQNQSGSHAQQGRAQPVYDTSHGGHYGKTALRAIQTRQARACLRKASPSLSLEAHVHQGLTGQYKDILTTYWQQTINHLESDNHDYKLHQLPLARIKKVMKADPEVKMISAEAPILFAKGCDIFITELTMRAWIHAEENKRRTLQRSDIASALAKSDMFDFLIDIVPREEASSHAKRTAGQAAPAGQGVPAQAASQISGQHGAIPQAANHSSSSHPMATTDYGLAGHALGPDQDYRQNPNMYPGQVQPGPSAPYGQAQQGMYGEIEGMYGYGTMQPQQVS
ncbi:hypothetical protein KNSL1_013367 [Colletotrichum chrysophilum]|nr:hypothetical protein KNSL1_013367 [Colletotrichum chrysophilum]